MSRLYIRTKNQWATINALPVTAEPITFSAWINPFYSQSNQEIVAAGNSTQWFILRLTLFGTIAVGTNDATTQSFSTTTATANVNTWSHTLGLFTSTSSRTAYLNGVAATADTATRTPSLGLITQIGANNNGNPFNGQIAEVGIWNVALDANEIAALAAGVVPLSVRPAALVGYWPFWGDDSPEPDWNPSGTLNTMVLTGPPVKADNPPVLLPVGNAGNPSSAAMSGGGGVTIPTTIAFTATGASRTLRNVTPERSILLQ